MAYVGMNGQAVMSDGNPLDFNWEEVLETATDYGTGIVTDAAAKAKAAALDKLGEVLGTNKDVPPKSNEQVPTNPAGSGTTVIAPPPPTTQTASGTAPAGLPPAADPGAAKPDSSVMSTVKQFPGWGIGLASGVITYLVTDSIIGGLAVAGGGWFLFDKATK